VALPEFTLKSVSTGYAPYRVRVEKYRVRREEVSDREKRRGYYTRQLFSPSLKFFC
jgi:hypothetical protein